MCEGERERGASTHCFTDFSSRLSTQRTVQEATHDIFVDYGAQSEAGEGGGDASKGTGRRRKEPFTRLIQVGLKDEKAGRQAGRL